MTNYGNGKRKMFVNITAVVLTHIQYKPFLECIGVSTCKNKHIVDLMIRRATRLLQVALTPIAHVTPRHPGALLHAGILPAESLPPPSERRDNDASQLAGLTMAGLGIEHWSSVCNWTNMCAIIIGTPTFNTLYNLHLPIKQHGVFSRNI